MEAVTKCAVVTGGSSGIGQGIAIVLAEHGYDVAITYGKNPDGAEKTRQQIEALGRRCFVYQATMPEADVPAPSWLRQSPIWGLLWLGEKKA